MHKARRRQVISPALIAAGVGGVILVGVIGWLLFGILTRFKVTVNGEEVTLDRGATIQTLLDKELASPKPGNLLAVDGSLLEKGKGYVCTATIDGKSAKVDSPLAAGNDVKITDGKDKTEKYDETEETIKADKSEGDRSFEAYWYGSIHLLSDGEDGTKVTKTGKQSGKTVSEVTKEPIDAGYRIYTANPDEKVIALTFDDGPWPETTDEILDILEEYDAKATFFTIGEQISETPDPVKRADAMGCQVLTHTYDHAAGSGGGTSIATMSSEEQVKEIEDGYDAIKDVLGKEPAHILRAPGGNFYGDVIDNVWDIVDAEIGWDVDTEDWSRPGSDSILKMILSAKSGQVVLMHDGGGDRSQTVEALRQAMPELKKQGYKFVTIDELLAYGMPSSKSTIPTTDDGKDEEKDTETDKKDTEKSTESEDEQSESADSSDDYSYDDSSYDDSSYDDSSYDDSSY